MSDINEMNLFFQQISTRLDNHGAEIHALGEKMDKKFDQLFLALSEYKKESRYATHAIDTRVTKLESERGMLWKVLTVIFGTASGFISGWFSNKL